ncbi:MAG: polysaccharide biosynthesis tyrosine autokinase [Pseudomonadota bacterium]|nr:polysaccharide biosynthesis tyrosine autokinase [Pseudomonadota bacterium]
MNTVNQTYQEEVQQQHEAPVEYAQVDLREHIAVLAEHKKPIGFLALAGFCIAAIYGFLATPEYSANALVQVEDEKQTSLSALQDISSMFEGKNSIETEIQIIKSRMVLGHTAEELNLNIQVEPHYFPYIGRMMARKFEQSQAGVAEPLLGFDAYAWGGEILEVAKLEVPDFLKGNALRLVVEHDSEYTLYDGDEYLLKGRVGQDAVISLKDVEKYNRFYDQQYVLAREQEFSPYLKINIEYLKARAGTEFTVAKQHLYKSAESLNSTLKVHEKGKQSGMLALSFTSIHQHQVADVLNQIVNSYVDQNLERSAAEARLSLEFLERQLPPLKEQLDAAENAYNKYRVQHGSVDLDAETTGLLTEMSHLGAAILELEQERKELRNLYKPEHSVIKALDEKIQLLKIEQRKLEIDADVLPNVQKDILRLKRDVEMNTILYSKLLNTTQELKVAQAGNIGYVRVVDYAFEPEAPFKPNKALLAVFGAMGGMMLGVFLTLFRHGLRNKVDNPEEIEQTLGLPVYASVLHSEEQANDNRKLIGRKKGMNILTQTHPESLTVECLRSLRTTLYFSMQSAANNIILTSGPSPNIGKTFTSINLGAVLAETDKKVLVIDADLRRGTLHQYIKRSREHGLSDLLLDDSHDLKTFIKNTTVPNLDVITSGQIPANPAELLMHSRFEMLLKELSEQYDIVILDAPPILAVTDSMIIAQHAGVNLMVAKFNTHQMHELEAAQKQFETTGLKINGIVFNDVIQTANQYGYGQYVYRYEYTKEEAK